MKKICLLLALSLMLSICAGCGSGTGETTVPTTLPAQTTVPTTVPEETLPIPTDPPDPKVIDYAFALPEGFEPWIAEENRFVFVSPMAPLDTSTVTVEREERNEAILTMSQNEYTDLIDPTKLPEPTEPSLPSEPSEPSEPDATMPTTEPEETTPPVRPEKFLFYDHWETEIDGWDAIACEYTLVYEQYMSHILRYEVVVNDCNYVFTFADNTDDNLWLERYKETVDSIDLILDTEGIELDYSGLTMYDLHCGLTIWAEGGMDYHEAPGFTACIGSRNVIILVMADDKQTNNLTEMTLDDYADLVCQNNGLKPFKWDTYGSLCTSFYSTDDSGMEYYNVICVKETAEDFWVFQMACSSNDQAKYAKAFSLWASSVLQTPS